MKNFMKNLELVAHLDQLLEVSQFRDYCPNGLQVEGQTKVKKIGFAVSATIDSIQKAKQWGADALIVHHGILWNHDGVQPITGPLKTRIELLLNNKMNLIAYHLPLDAHLEFGNAAQLAAMLGMVKIKGFGDYKARAVGVSGTLPKLMKVANIISNLKKILNHDIIHAAANSETIKSVAIVTGGGASYYKQACQEGIDLFITGEMSEYHWHGAKELDIHLLAGGHHATERFGVMALRKYISQKFKLETEFFDSENPV